MKALAFRIVAGLPLKVFYFLRDCIKDRLSSLQIIFRLADTMNSRITYFEGYKIILYGTEIIVERQDTICNNNINFKEIQIIYKNDFITRNESTRGFIEVFILENIVKLKINKE